MLQEIEDNIIYNKLIKIEENIDYRLQMIENNIHLIELNNINNNKIVYTNFYKIYKQLLFIDFSIFIVLMPYIYYISKKNN